MMFVLSDIETLPEDAQNLPQGTVHKLTFKAVYTIKEVPDSFTGIVFEQADGGLALQHFKCAERQCA